MRLLDLLGRPLLVVPAVLVVLASACAPDAPADPAPQENDVKSDKPSTSKKKPSPPKPSTQTPAPSTSQPPPPAPQSNQPPTLTRVEPSFVTLGSAAKGVDVTLTGTKFPSAVQVSLAGDKLPAVFISPTQVKVHIAPEKLKTTGVLRLVVLSKAGESNPLTFTVANPTSTSIAKLSPTSATLGDYSVTLDITGTGFTDQSVVKFNGTALDTSFTSGTELSATVPSDVLVDAGRVGVSVSLGNDVISLPVAFEIRNPIPSADSISPSTVTAGAAAATVTLFGDGMTKGSTVLANGQPVSTTYLTSTSVRAIVPSKLIAKTGSVSLTVQNGSPGGGSSNAVAIAITAGDPGTKPTGPDCPFLCSDYGYALGECYDDYFCIDTGSFAGCLGQTSCGGGLPAPAQNPDDTLPAPSGNACTFSCKTYGYDPGECTAGWYCWISDGCLTQSVCN